MHTIFGIVLFAALGIGILLGGHYFLYFSLIKFFSINKPSAKTVLLLALSFLALSFIISSIIVHFNHNLFFRIFYLVSASWWGIIMNLLVGAALIWLVVWLAKLIEFKVEPPAVAAIIFSLAIIVSVAGFFNAFHPRVKNIEVEMKNLPPEWKGKTIIQLSDVHLGYINQPGFLADIVQKINALEPDLVLITGDLFDGMDGDLDIFIKPLNDIKAKKGIFFVTGNHETYLGLENTFSILDKTGIKVLNDESVDVDGLQIVGISYPATGGFSSAIGRSENMESTIKSMDNFDRSKPSILMRHAPTDIDQAKAAGINLQLSGHAHRGQIFPINIINQLIYGKYAYGFYRQGDFSIYTTSGAGSWGPPMRTTGAPEIVAVKIR